MVINSLQTETLKHLDAYALSEIFIEPSGQCLSFGFTSSIGEPSIRLKLFNPALIKISRTLDDEGLFLVGEARLASLEDGGKDVFAFLGYDFRNLNGSLLTYPSRPLLHFHLEGDVCIDVICENCEMLRANEV
ncbi:MAG TPA: hypothetical protein VKB86_09365 [Pyrinomonadaceae bacterium]|nr:hypothetical protein [Pyrinomonadaceae bacterium]